MEVRQGESDKKVWFRSERLLQIDNGWYFLTRENTQEGPFGSRSEAERELIYYIRFKNQFDVFSEYELDDKKARAQ